MTITMTAMPGTTWKKIVLAAPVGFLFYVVGTVVVATGIGYAMGGERYSIMLLYAAHALIPGVWIAAGLGFEDNALGFSVLMIMQTAYAYIIIVLLTAAIKRVFFKFKQHG